MELWIRSQDKQKLCKVHNLCVRENQNENDEINYVIQDIFTMGIYATKERALEVLDEIQKKINLICMGNDFGSPMVDLKNPAYIYEMPED